MPTLQRIEPDQTIQGGQLSIQSAQAPGLAVSRVGDEVDAIGSDALEQQIHLQQLNDFAQRSTDAGLAIDQAVSKEQEDPDFRTQPQRVDDAIQKISADTLGDVKSPEVRARLLKYLNDVRETSIINARHFARTSEIQYGQSIFDKSLLASRNRLAGLSGLDLDQEMSHTIGLSKGAVAAGLYSEGTMNDKMSDFMAGVTLDKARIDGINNPAATVSDLVKGTLYNDLNPTKRLDLAQQVIRDAGERANAQNKAFTELRTQTVGKMTASALQGQLTYQQLNDANASWNFGREDYEHMFDLIGKPPQQLPSDPKTLSNLQIAVNSATPTATKQDLAQAYNGGSGKLNLNDYTDLSIQLQKNLQQLGNRDLAELRTREHVAEQYITTVYGANRELHGMAMKYLTDNSAAVNGHADPMALLPDIDKQLGPAMQRLGGLSQAGALGQFNSARRAHQTALDDQTKWDTQHYAEKYVFTNPNDAKVNAAQADLLNKAATASKILGDAAPGVPDGKSWTRPDGVNVFVVGGKVIAE